MKEYKKEINQKESQIDFVVYKIKELQRKKHKLEYMNKKF